MRLEDFSFELPPDQIAQTPANDREASRLMVLDRAKGAVTETIFTDIVSRFRRGDLLVLNDTRVFPARLHGSKESGGKVELLLVRRIAGTLEDWVCMTKSSKPPREGSVFHFDDGVFAVVLNREQDQYWRLRFSGCEDFAAWLERVGRLPLPPYIRRQDDDYDRERYQTVYARSEGSVAAPTAGLHFTPGILTALEAKGVEIRRLTLHVGPGTFLPVRVEDVRQHRMHLERFTISPETAQAVNRAKDEGRRVIAVGTTTTRTLEYFLDRHGRLKSGSGETDLFIYPGFRFRVIDGLVTNFHLPHSTLLMLVAALGGKGFVLQAYRRAVDSNFRFFSYGDCMLIL